MDGVGEIKYCIGFKFQKCWTAALGQDTILRGVLSVTQCVAAIGCGRTLLGKNPIGHESSAIVNIAHASSSADVFQSAL
jgi:hypothetical protein